MTKTTGLGRRDFLKGLTAAALTAGFIGPSEAAQIAAPAGLPKYQNFLSDLLLPFPEITAPRGTEDFWNQVRQTFVVPDNYIHLNTGTTGSQPIFSLINLGVYNVYKSLDPRDWQANLNADYPDLFPLVNNSALTARQAAVAAQYGADQSEIILSYNTTDACNLIFAGTPWNPGDRIICTHWEHNALAGPIVWARDYHGVDVRIVELPSNFSADITVADVLAAFEAELSRPRPQKAKHYLATSEVFYKNGLRLPIKELCALAKSYGAYTIIDTAQGWGHLPINCHDYGADFLAGAGHKWLCGGPGTGISYIRNSGANLPPFTVGNLESYGNLFTVPSTNYDNRSRLSGNSVQDRGEINTPALYAMSDSAAYFNYLGVPEIYQRGVALGDYLKAKIEAQWGRKALWVQRNPATDAFATALTSFNPFLGRDDGSQFDALDATMNKVLATLAAEDPKIYLRTVTWRDRKTDTADNRLGFRVSTHGVYNNRAQIDYMFDRLVAAIDATGLEQLG